MLITDLLASPVLPRAVVLGAFGGVGLVLTTTYSRRGPFIYPVYAALLAALALLLARYPAVPFAGRFGAALAGVATASALLYAAVMRSAAGERARLRARGQQLPAGAGGPGAVGHLWRAGVVLGLGALASAGVAFVAA